MKILEQLLSVERIQHTVLQNIKITELTNLNFEYFSSILIFFNFIIIFLDVP